MDDHGDSFGNYVSFENDHHSDDGANVVVDMPTYEEVKPATLTASKSSPSLTGHSSHSKVSPPTTRNHSGDHGDSSRRSFTNSFSANHSPSNSKEDNFTVPVFTAFGIVPMHAKGSRHASGGHHNPFTTHSKRSESPSIRKIRSMSDLVPGGGTPDLDKAGGGDSRDGTGHGAATASAVESHEHQHHPPDKLDAGRHSKSKDKGGKSKESMTEMDANKKMEPKLLGSISRCTALALCTPDGEHIVAAGGSGPGSVRVVNGKEPFEVVKETSGHSSYAFCICVVNDSLIASGGYEVIKFWNAKTFECVHIMKGHEGYIYAICAVDSKRIATASNDKTICVWGVHKGQYSCLAVLKEHKDWVRTLCSLPEKRFASGSDDMTIKIWSSMPGYACLATFSGHQNWILCLCPLPGDRIASGSRDNTIKIWSCCSGLLFGIKTSLITTLTGHTSSVRTLSVLPDGKLVSGSRDRSVRVWKLPPLSVKKQHHHHRGHEDEVSLGKCLGVIESHENNGVYSVCCLSNGNIVVSSEDHCIQLWSLSWVVTNPACDDKLVRASISPVSSSGALSPSSASASRSTSVSLGAKPKVGSLEDAMRSLSTSDDDGGARSRHQSTDSCSVGLRLSVDSGHQPSSITARLLNDCSILEEENADVVA